jgi:hypothetical protein
MANDQQDDAVDPRQKQPRPGKGSDTGPGYGGAGKATEGTEIPRGTDEHSDGGRERDPEGADLDGPLGGERRNPGR